MSAEPPTIADLLVPMTSWLTVIGVLVLVFDGGPWWLGVGFIVAGAWLTKTFARSDATVAEAAGGA